MTRQDDLKAVLRDAQDFYRSQLPASWVPEYLAERGLAAGMKDIGIGFAPSGWRSTTKVLLRRGHSPEAIRESGVGMLSNRTGDTLDALRDRLTIPVHDTEGDVIGFTARRAPEAGDDIPKYVNTKTTELFHKSQLLFGLHEDAARLRRSAMPILVEGAMDRLAIHSARGALDVVAVAPLGTALTDRQVQALLETVGPRRPVAVAYDNDPAGRAATLHAWELLRTHTSEVLAVDLPTGKDPADLVQNGAARQLRSAITGAQPLAFAAADAKIATAGRLDHVGRRLTLMHDLLNTDFRFLHPCQMSAYVVHLSTRLDLDPASVTKAAVEVVSPDPDQAAAAAHTHLHSSLGFPDQSSHRTNTSHLRPNRATAVRNAGQRAERGLTA